MIATDVVEVDVDAVGSDLCECAPRTLLAIVERVVEAECANPGDLLRRPGAADHAATGDAGHLAGCTADRARGSRDEHGLTLLRLAEDEETVPRAQPPHAGHPARRLHA